MIRTVPAWSLLAVAFAVLAVPARAAEAGEIFDGSGGASLEILSAKSPAALAAAAEAGEAGQAAVAAAPSKQSGKDLYYFTKEEAAAAQKKFGMRAESADGNGMVFDRDVPADIQQQMIADMAFIGTIAGGAGTPLHQKIFGAVDGATYVRFFNSRVTGIGMNDCGMAKAVACVIPMRDPSKMWLTQNFVKFDHPQIARMMVVFHESRHTETRHGNWPHATCPTPFLDANGKDMVSIWTGASLAGEPACDVTPLGSYGSSTIMLKNVQKFCTNCTDKVKMDAGLFADDQLGRITDAGAKKEMQSDFGE